MPGLILLNRSDLETAALKSLIFPISSRSAEYNSPDWFPFTSDLASFQGVQFGLPLFVDPLVLAYPSQSGLYAPATWQEIVSKSSPIAVFLNDPTNVLPFTIYLSAGGHVTDDKGTPILEADPLTRTYQTLSNGAASSVFPAWLPDLQSGDDALNALRQGQATYGLLWASQVLQTSRETVSLFPVPGSTSIPAGFVDGWMMCITSSSADQSRNAVMLADFLLSPDFLAQWSEAEGYLPAQKSVLVEWQNKELAQRLEKIADQSMIVPSNAIQNSLGTILNQYTISLIRRQTSPIQAVLDTLSALEVK
jgi:ABC-type glycerol-3-phosphate transport system substrate-binding protein